MIGQHDFSVDWKGSCFFCWTQIPTQLPSAPVNPDPESTNKSFPVYSLQCLSRYLQIDMSKVFHGDGAISPDLLVMVQKSKLKVKLCSECASINANLSEMFRKLEKIEMEMATCLQLIQSKLEKSKVTKEDKEFEMIAESESFSGGKLQIVKWLRMETIQKCSQKVSKLLPKVRIQNLTPKGVIEEISGLIGTTVLFPTKSAVVDTEPDTLPELTWEDIADEEVDIGDMKMTVPFHPFPNLTPDINPEDGNANELAFSHSVQLKSETSQEVKLEQLESPSLHLDSTPIPKPVGRSHNPKWTVNPNTGKHACRDCYKEFSTVSSFYRHYDSIHLKIKHKCYLCKIEFSKISGLRRHQSSLHKLKKCKVCKQIFPLESTHWRPKGCPDKSLSALEMTRPSKPPKLNGQIGNMSSFIPNTGRHKCNICPKAFMSQAGFQRHYKAAHAKVRCRCTICGQEFSRLDNYKRHHKRVHQHWHPI